MSLLSRLQFILPEIILFVFALAALSTSFFSRGRNTAGLLSLAGIVSASVSFLFSGPGPKELIFNMLAGDPFSIFFKLLCLFATGVVILISMGYKALPDDCRSEYYFLILTATIAMLLAVSSNTLLMIYVSVEMLSLVSYLLVAFHKRDGFSSEGALKYFLFGALSTGIMLYGISLAYGLFGTCDLTGISSVLRSGRINLILASVPLLFILAGLSFKCALVPFHMWVPDAYQGAPTAVSAFISTGPKVVGFAVLLRLFAQCFYPVTATWTDLLVVISVLTMTIGNIIAIWQTDIKRMLGYSAIAHAGFILMGVVAGSALGIESTLYYILAYALMNLGAFGCVVLISNSIKNDSLNEYSGLYKKDPGAAFMLTLFLLSLAGIPPLAGFFAKFFVFAAAIQSKLYFLAIAGAVNSVIAAFYYLKVIKHMYLDEPADSPAIAKSIPLKIALLIVLAGVLVVGLAPHVFLNWISLSRVIYS